MSGWGSEWYRNSEEGAGRIRRGLEGWGNKFRCSVMADLDLAIFPLVPWVGMKVLNNLCYEAGWLCHILSIFHNCFCLTFWLLLFACWLHSCLSILKLQCDSKLCVWTIPYPCDAIHSIASWMKPSKWRRKMVSR